MSTPVGSSQWMYTPASGFYPYLIDQALRFDDASNAYLNKTYSTAQTNTNKITASFWFKLSEISTTRMVFLHARNGGGGEIKLNSHKIYANLFDTGYDGFYNNALLRDPSAWYHLVYQGDSTLSTAADRNRVWLNGVELDNNASSYTLQNTDTYFLRNGLTSNIGRNVDNSSHDMDGYMAQIHVIDGSIVDVTSFGETINGIWVPKEYSGSHGNNGFYLSFSDSSAIGDDESGNGNDFTANNLAAHDVVPDSPTNNFATWNPLDNHNYNAPSEGNLRALTAGNNGTQNSTFAVSSGKWYWEARNGSAHSGSMVRLIGIAKEDTNITSTPYSNSDCYLWYGNGDKYNGSSSSYGDSWGADGDIVGVAFDADNGALWFSKNGTWQNSATTSEIAAGTTTNAAFTSISGTYVMMVSKTGGTSSNDPHHANFGQDSTFAGATTAGGNADANGIGDFKYSVPDGFLAMCSKSLPEPLIGPNSSTQSDDHFNTVLYTGTGASNSITGVGFGSAPDFTWIKSRSAAYNNVLWDTVRGATKQLSSNTTGAESTQAQGLTSFDSDGFTLGTNANLNNSGSTYVAWNWKAGGTAVSNTDGSITSSVSAAPDAGFSICTWTGNATAGATVGHGLSSAPELIFSKRRDSSGMWTTYAKPAASDAETDYLRLDGTDALADDSRIWNDTVPTASVFTVGSGTSHINVSGATHVTYCFHSSDICKVGSYVGNGSTDGTFVYTGFRPAWIMLKRLTSGAGWSIFDNTRNAYNPSNAILQANTSNAEGTSYPMDFVSNGVKIRNSDSTHNQSGVSYIYLCFADGQPFKYANAR